MRSFFLEGVAGIEQAEVALSFELPGQRQPWILESANGDPVAYVRVESELDGEPNVHVVADLSGRHYHEDATVVALLHRLQRSLGGLVTDDT